MGRIGRLLAKGFGLFLVALLILATVATILGIALAIVWTVVSAIATLAVLGVFLAVAYGLFVLFWGGDDAATNADAGGEIGSELPASDPPSDRELVDRLRERYVAGELDESEFERRMELLLEPGRGVVDGDDSAAALDPDRELQRE